MARRKGYRLTDGLTTEQRRARTLAWHANPENRERWERGMAEARVNRRNTKMGLRRRVSVVRRPWVEGVR
jgi:hypothetical protein